MAFNGQLGRNGRSPLRQAALKADNQTSQKAISANNINRSHSPHYAGEVKIIDESMQRVGAKTFRLLPYQSARGERTTVSTAAGGPTQTGARKSTRRVVNTRPSNVA